MKIYQFTTAAQSHPLQDEIWFAVSEDGEHVYSHVSSSRSFGLSDTREGYLRTFNPDEGSVEWVEVPLGEWPPAAVQDAVGYLQTEPETEPSTETEEPEIEEPEEKPTLGEIHLAVQGMQKELETGGPTVVGPRFREDLETLIETSKRWLEVNDPEGSEPPVEEEVGPLYLYFDAETPGLDEEMGVLEGGWFVTPDINVAGELRSRLTDADPEASFLIADDFVRKMHTDNGLWVDLRTSVSRLPIETIEQEILDDIGDHKGPVYLVGNSIRLDRAFIQRWMPTLDRRLHYRQIDLTSVRLFLEGFGFDTTREGWSGNVAHRAGDDVMDSFAFADHLGSIVIAGWKTE